MPLIERQANEFSLHKADTSPPESLSYAFSFSLSRDLKSGPADRIKVRRLTCYDIYQSMASAAAKQYFGYCIAPNKNATPIFEQLLVGIYGYIVKHVAPWDVHYLTPVKLAQFYRLVGGNFDRLFLDSPPSSLSFVYSSLGCQHTLHQDKNFYEPPTIPALTVQGFVRWQVIQVLLYPTEHVPYLQEAVKRFEIHNGGPGGAFPKVLPAECLPKAPDADMVKWHTGVEQRLRYQAEMSSKNSARRDTNSGGMSSERMQRGASSSHGTPDLRSPHSRTPRRHSSSDVKNSDRAPNSAQSPKDTRRFRKASVMSASSSSSSSSPSPQLRPSRLANPERSPRSYSLMRHPPAAQAYDTARRHSSHAIHGSQEPAGRPRNVLSPQFFGQEPSQPTGAATGLNSMPAETPPQSNMMPNSANLTDRVRNHRHSVSYDRSREVPRRDGPSNYVNTNTADDDGDKRRTRSRNFSEGRRSADRSRRSRESSDDRGYVEKVRFVDGVGGLPLDREPISPEQGQWDRNRDSRRKSRLEGHRRRSRDVSSDH